MGLRPDCHGERWASLIEGYDGEMDLRPDCHGEWRAGLMIRTQDRMRLHETITNIPRKHILRLRQCWKAHLGLKLSVRHIYAPKKKGLAVVGLTEVW